jgi:hypothetical protein
MSSQSVLVPATLARLLARRQPSEDVELETAIVIRITKLSASKSFRFLSEFFFP